MACIYILLYKVFFENIEARPQLVELFKYSDKILLIILLVVSIIIGSLYTTFLEGVVDNIHRKHVETNTDLFNSKLKRIIVNSLLPYSLSSKKRLELEATRFYEEFEIDMSLQNEESKKNFIKSVYIETLWMEGKIAGTPLEQPYDRIRSEGEIRVAGGLLIPLVCPTVSYALYSSEFQIVLSMVIGVIVSIAIVNYGFYYYKKANSFLAHHIADGKVLSPSMETLKRRYDNISKTDK